MIRDITIKDMVVHGEEIKSANQCRMGGRAVQEYKLRVEV